MVSQDILWTMVKEYPGHTAEYYAKILAGDNKLKLAFYKEDVYSAMSWIRKWKMITEEWHITENGPIIHYFPVNLMKVSERKEYNPADYSSALVEDRIKRGWSKEAAEYAFPSKEMAQIRYLAKFNKGIVNYIRKNKGCTFEQIGDYLRTAHRRCSYVPRCSFNAHLQVIIDDLLEAKTIYCVDNIYYVHTQPKVKK